MSTFCPFVCENGHHLEVEGVLQVNELGREACCSICHFAVTVDREAVAAGIKEAVTESFLQPEIYVIDSGGLEKKLLDIECLHCHQIFQSTYRGMKYCSKKCRDDARREAALDTIACIVCGNQFKAPDRRYRICKPECKNNRRRKTHVD